MAEQTNVVNPGQSPTPPATSTPSNPGSPASPASSKPEDVKPQGTQAPAQQAAGDKPPETKPDTTTVPIAALHEERQKRQTADAKLAQLTALFGDKFKIDEQGNIVPIQQTPGSPTPQAPQTQEQYVKELNKAWEEDPRKAVNMEMMMALNWYDSLTTSIETQKDVVRAKYPDFGNFENEVSRHLKKLPMDQRAQAGAVELAYLVAKGSKADSMLQSEKDKAVAELIKRIQAGEQIQGITGGTVSVPSSTSGPKPTSEQIQAANAMGMKIEDYMKYSKK